MEAKFYSTKSGTTTCVLWISMKHGYCTSAAKSMSVNVDTENETLRLCVEASGLEYYLKGNVYGEETPRTKVSGLNANKFVLRFVRNLLGMESHEVYIQDVQA